MPLKPIFPPGIIQRPSGGQSFVSIPGIVKVGSCHKPIIQPGFVQVSAGASNSPEAQQFFDRLASPPSGALETAYNDFIDGLVAAGLWDAFDMICLHSVATQGDSVTNLIAATPAPTPELVSGTLTFTANSGWLASTAGRLNSNFNPSTAVGAQFQRNSACLWYWSGTTANSNNYGIRQWNGAVFLTEASIYPKWAGAAGGMQVNSASETNGTAANSGGLFLGNRTASNVQEFWHNGVKLANNAAASAALSNAVLVNHASYLSRAWGFGRGLTTQENEDLHTLLSAFVTATVGSTP